MDQQSEKWILIENVQFKTKRCLDSHNNTGLSAREIETLIFLGYGLSSNEIAAKMTEKPNTIATYKTRIFDKFGVTSTAEAMALASAILTGAEYRLSATSPLAAA